jgi:hypothetical protein
MGVIVLFQAQLERVEMDWPEAGGAGAAHVVTHGVTDVRGLGRRDAQRL